MVAAHLLLHLSVRATSSYAAAFAAPKAHGVRAVRSFAASAPRRAAAAAAAASTSSSSNRTVLCFDINKTVVLSDAAGGKTARALCNEALADACWGSAAEGSGGFACAAGVPLSLERPSQKEALVTYSEWARARHPDVPGSDDASRAANRANKAARDALRARFADVGGDAAPAVAALLEPLLAKARVPAAVRAAAGAAEAGLAERDTWFLMPSFLAAVRRRCEAGGGGGGAPFSLQFRTFGHDLPGVAREWNAFCTGAHPLHRGFAADGTAGTVDRRVCLDDALSHGAFFRDAEGPVLVLGGAGDQPTTRAAALAAARDGATVADGVEACHALLTSDAALERTMAVRDYWPFWRDQGEAGAAGKLVCVGGAGGPRVVFVDDNARGPDGHIVDVREAGSWAPLPWADAVGRGHVVQADPYRALMEEGYFDGILNA